MTPDHWLLIALLAAPTIGLRVVGYMAGGAMMRRPIFKRILDVFPGCLITALVASSLAQGGPAHIGAAVVALTTAVLLKNIIGTMVAGMAAFAILGWYL